MRVYNILCLYFKDLSASSLYTAVFRNNARARTEGRL